jgi:hypothetical protein
MKIIYKVEVEIDDDYIKKWTEDYISYDVKYNKVSREDAIKRIKENKPLENSFIDIIEDTVMSCGTFKNCKAEIYESKMD